MKPGDETKAPARIQIATWVRPTAATPKIFPESSSLGVTVLSEQEFLRLLESR